MRKNIYLILIFFSILLFTSSASSQEYVVGGDSDYFPFTFVDKTGKVSGMEIDVLEAISDQNNFDVNFKLTSWNTALSNIQLGETDIITGIIFSEERAKYLDFTIPIHTEYYSIFIRKDLPFEGLSSLYDYKPVVLDKDVSIEKFLVPMGLLENHVLVKSIPEALATIELGLADYVLAPNSLGLHEIKTNKYINIEIKGPAIIPSIYCMAVQKGDTALLTILNNGIVELRRNGQIEEIHEKWLNIEKDDSHYKQIAKVVGVVFLVSLILLILAYLWVRVLRLQINKKTESLNLKNQELQKSEEKFRVITENSSDIIWHLDSNYILTYISPSDERIRGFRKEDILGRSLFSILKPEGIEVLKEANEKRLNNLRKGILSPPAIYQLEQICKDGTWIWVEATATPFYDQDAKITGYHGVSRDISVRKKAEQLLKERESQLIELNSTKDKLFSIIAHDLRSPFNTILGFSQLLIDKLPANDEDETGTYLGHIYSSAQNTLILLDNLLNWARSQTGRSICNPEKADLRGIVDEIFAMSSASSNVKNIALNYTPTIDVEVYTDVDMLKTILRNLISNAIKYTHSNGEITISALQSQDDIEITVSDNGVGMSDEIRNKLFEIETNITTVGTANEKGSGLGLVLCKEFVEKLGGKIWGESEDGKGSDFKFTLPLDINSLKN